MLNISQMEWHCLNERMDRSAKNKNKGEERLRVHCDLFLGRCITCNISYSVYISYINTYMFIDIISVRTPPRE